MKTVFLVVFLAAVAAVVHGLPLGSDPEWAMVPDEDGAWKLVNVNGDSAPENFYNPETDIIFTLFTRSTQTDGEVIEWNNSESIRNSRFNPSHPTRVTIHGWNGGANARVNTAVHRSLFQVGDFNCITVDWTAGGNTANYIAARNRVGETGELVARLVRRLIEEFGADPREVSAIGHSLGAHVAGFIGKNIPDMGTVVALDAALPLFSIDSPHARVAVTDAHYVESYHTNAGLLGFDLPLGHSNFYPNFGRRQPGCGVDPSGFCAHARAHEFLAESIVSEVGFVARQCRDYQDIVNGNCVFTGVETRMGGEPLNWDARGIFWLETNDEAPFAQGRTWN